MRLVPLTETLLTDRSAEIGRYLEFLKVAVKRRAMLCTPENDATFLLELELTHTLKASLVLLLYSAMEATLVQLLDEMHNAIGTNCSSADLLNNELLRVVLKTIQKGGALSSTAPLHQSLFTYWIEDWQNRESAKEKRGDGISGSVDSRVFYEQLKKFGVVAPNQNDKPPSHLTNHALQTVKTRRNELAHGEKSFTDLGRSLSVESLEDDYDKVFSTLRNIATEVHNYLRDQRYLARPPATVASPAMLGTEA